MWGIQGVSIAQNNPRVTLKQITDELAAVDEISSIEYQKD